MSTLNRSFLTLLAASLAMLVGIPSAAASGAERVVDQARLTVGDLVDDVSPELSDVDLGTTPPPGGTRVVTAAQVRRAVSAAGLDAKKLTVPNATRVKSAARRLKPSELEQAVGPQITQQLKTGVTLQRVEIRRTVTVAPRSTVGGVYMPRLPRRQGVHQLTATVGIMTDGEETQRVPVSISVQVNAAGALPDVTRGAEVTLMIARGSAKISAVAHALGNADVGETTTFRVAKTKTILRGVVLTSRTARVVAQ